MSIFQEKVALNSDCIEFCPFEGHQNVFSLSNYQLEAESGVKHGKVSLYEVESDAETENVTSFRRIEEVKTGAIFDFKWRDSVTQSGKCLCAAVDSDGKLAVYQMGDDRKLSEECSASVDPSLVFLDWQPTALCSDVASRIATSDSLGFVRVFDVTDDSVVETHTWKGHEYEGWVTTFDRHSPHTLYSGADDCVFKGWDLRTQTPTFINKIHGAGVCIVQDNPHEEHTLATGSYDDILRIWDKRSVKRPVREKRMDAGVWRVKWHPSPAHPSTLLLGCMRGGFHVVRTDSDETLAAEPLSSFLEHGEDLAYGCDWSFQPGREKLIVSCSFYDNLVYMWESSAL